MKKLFPGFSWAIAFICTVGLIFMRLGAMPLMDVDEGAFAQATREMRATGDWIVPRLGGEPRFDKPPFIYWLQALSVWLLGESNAAFRLPSAIAGALWALATVFFAASFLGWQKGWASGTILSTALMPLAISRAATADAVLNLCLALSLFSLYLAMQGRRGFRPLFFLFLALGVLGKGLVALAVPLGAGFLYSASKKDLPGFFRLLSWRRGLALFFLLVLPWTLLVSWRQGDFLGGLIWHHHVERFLSPMQGHSGPLWYYLPVLFLGVFPYSWLVPLPFLRFKEALDDDFSRFCHIWFGFVFLFFSFSQTKLPHYLLYGLTPFCMLLASSLNARVSKTLFFAPLVFLAAGALFLPALLQALAASAWTQRQDAFAFAAAHAHGAPSWGLASLLLLCLAWLLPKSLGFLWAGAGGVAALLGWAAPISWGMSGAVVEAGQAARVQEGPKVFFRINRPSFGPACRCFFEKRPPRLGDIVLTKELYLPMAGPGEVLYQKDGIALVKMLGPRQVNGSPAP